MDAHFENEPFGIGEIDYQDVVMITQIQRNSLFGAYSQKSSSSKGNSSL